MPSKCISLVTRLGSSASSVISLYDHAGAQRKGGPRFEQTYTDAVDETYDLGQFGDGDKVLALLETAPSQDTTGVLRADILVNGVVRATCELTGPFRGVNSCEVETAEL